jgi:hypothetical protein
MATCSASIDAVLSGTGTLKALMECTGADTHAELVFKQLYPYIQLVKSGAKVINKKQFENDIMLGITSFDTYNSDHNTYLQIVSNPDALIQTLNAIVSQFGKQLTSKGALPDKKVEAGKAVRENLRVLKIIARNWRFWLEKLVTEKEKKINVFNLPWYSTDLYWCGGNKDVTKYVTINIYDITERVNVPKNQGDMSLYNKFLHALNTYAEFMSDDTSAAHSERMWVQSIVTSFMKDTGLIAAVKVDTVALPTFLDWNNLLKTRFFPTLRPLSQFCVPLFLLEKMGTVITGDQSILNDRNLLTFHLNSMKTLLFEKWLRGTQFETPCVIPPASKLSLEKLKLLPYLRKQATKNEAQKKYLKEMEIEKKVEKAKTLYYFPGVAKKVTKLDVILRNLAYTICPGNVIDVENLSCV